MPTSRVEAFSDGVFAIAITLLIIDVRPPHSAPGELAGDLVSIWPSYAAYRHLTLRHLSGLFDETMRAREASRAPSRASFWQAGSGASVSRPPFLLARIV
jgi:hypothetical protein